MKFMSLLLILTLLSACTPTENADTGTKAASAGNRGNPGNINPPPVKDPPVPPPGDQGRCPVPVVQRSGQRNCSLENATGTERFITYYCKGVVVETKTDGPCVFRACVQGYTRNAEGKCVRPTLCEPGKTEEVTCTLANASKAVKTQTCLANGNGYTSSTCRATQCLIGFELNNGICSPKVQKECNPGDKKVVSCKSDIAHSAVAENVYTCDAGGKYVPGTCHLKLCEGGFYVSGQVCLSNVCNPNEKSYITCTVQIANAAEARITKTCNSTGSGYASESLCELRSCQAGYVINGNTCQKIADPPVSKVSMFIDMGLYDPDLKNESRWVSLATYSGQDLPLGRQSLDDVQPLKIQIKIENDSASPLKVAVQETLSHFTVTLPSDIPAGKFDFVEITLTSKSIGEKRELITLKAGTVTYKLQLTGEII